MSSEFKNGLLRGVIVVFAVLLLCSESVAQENDNLQNVACAGWRGQSLSKTMDAVCLTATGRVEAVYPDSIHDVLYVLIRDMKRGKPRNSGNLVAFDFLNKRELWSVPFDYSNDHFFLSNGIPVISDERKSRGLIRHSGTADWIASVQIGMTTAQGVGIAKWGESWNQDVVGIDLRTGKELWRKKADFKDIKSFDIQGDTAVVFLQKGLNYINLNTGKGFYIEGKTLEAYKSYRSMNASGVAVAAGVLGGLVGGLIFGVVVVAVPVSTGSMKQRSANSLTDIYMGDSGVYFTTKKMFYKVNYNGDVLWQKPVDKSIGPIRKIFVTDDAAFLISKGMVVIDEQKTFNTPVMYRINKDGSGPLQNVQLNTVKREYVQDFLVKDSSVVIALNNKVVELSLKNLSILREKSFGKAAQNSSFGDILNPPAIVYQDSVFEMASEQYPDDFFVANRGGMKIRFSEALEPVAVIREKNFFGVHEELPNNRMIISNGTDDFLIDTDGKKGINLRFSPNVRYSGGWLFDFDGEKVFGLQL